MGTDLVAFQPGELVTWRSSYGNRYHATVSRMSHSGKRVKILYTYPGRFSSSTYSYVPPESLERGHV